MECSPRTRAEQIPSSFVCPLNLELMVDPVMVDPVEGEEANTYERANIEHWFMLGPPSDPLTNRRLKSKKLIENIAIRKAIQEFKDESPKLIAAIDNLDRKLHRAQAAAEAVGNQARKAVVPIRFLDKITHAVMKHPVRADDGNVYEKRVLLAHIRESQFSRKELTSPINNKSMGSYYEDDTALAAEISEFLETNFGSTQDVGAPIYQSSVVDLNSLFSALDDLKDILIETLGTWKPPFLIAFGGESVGKSTLLERLSLLPFFPTLNTRCTRMPIRVEIRRSATHQPATMAVWDYRAQREIGQPELLALETDQGLAAEKVQRKMNEVLEDDRGVSLDFELHIKATSTTLPPMNLVDLPGIVDTNPISKDRTEQLLARYVTEPDSRDIFLAVAEATTSPSNWTATRLVEHHRLADRAIGVITKCDRLEDVDVDKLRAWINGADIDGIVPLFHGYVGIANIRLPEKNQDECHIDWIRRKQTKELRKFLDMNMEDALNANSVSIHALLGRINTMYSWHVIDSWLPSTATRLLQVWHSCCKELRELGLPFSSGHLEGSALRSFRRQASVEVRTRLSFLVELQQSLFESSYIEPLQDYLQRKLEDLENVELHLFEIEKFLKDAKTNQIYVDLPIGNIGDEWLHEAILALESIGVMDSFKLHRLPQMMEQLRTNLRENKPNLDIPRVRKKIKKFLDDTFCPKKSSAMKVIVHKKGKAKVSFDIEKIVSVCLIEIAGAFRAIKTQPDLEAIILGPALNKQEQETCHQSRQRVYDRMTKSARALRKLFDMLRTNRGPVSEKDLVKSWWPEDARPLDLLAPGDSQKDDTFLEDACNTLTSTLKDILREGWQPELRRDPGATTGFLSEGEGQQPDPWPSHPIGGALGASSSPPQEMRLPAAQPLHSASRPCSHASPLSSAAPHEGSARRCASTSDDGSARAETTSFVWSSEGSR